MGALVVPLTSESQTVNDSIILKIIVCGFFFLGNKKEHESHSPPIGTLDTVISVLCSFLFLVTLFFYSVAFHQSSLLTGP